MIFDNVSFDVKKFKGALVEAQTLYIYTTDKTYDIDYKSGKQAHEALARLDAITTASSTSDAGSVLDSVQSIFGSVLKKAKDKGAEVVAGYDVKALVLQMAADAALDAAKAKGADILATLDEALSKVLTKDDERTPTADSEPPTPVRKEPQNKRFTVGEDAFNGEKEEELREPKVSELSDDDLEKAIDSFIDNSMNRPSTKQAFEQISSIFGLGPDDIEEVKKALKGMIFEVARLNPNEKLSEIIKRFLQ